MESSEKTIEELRASFSTMRDGLDAMHDLNERDFRKETIRLMRLLVDQVETTTLQQIAGYASSAKGFAAVTEALKTVMAALKENKR